MSKNYKGTYLANQEIQVLLELEKSLGEPIPYVKKIHNDTFGFTSKDNHVIGLGLYKKAISNLPDIFPKLKFLQSLNLSQCKGLKNILHTVYRLKSLKILNISFCEFDEKSYWEIQSLTNIDLINISGTSFNEDQKMMINSKIPSIIEDLSQNPDDIYEDFVKKRLNKTKATDLLISLMENSISSYVSIRGLEFLEKLGVKDKKILQFAENLLVSDNIPLVRRAAMKFLISNFPKYAQLLLKKVIHQEISIKVLIPTFRDLNHHKNHELKSLRNQLIEKFASFYGVVFEEGKFILELYLNTPEDRLNFNLNKEYANSCISNRLHDFIGKFVDTDWKPIFIIKNKHILSLDYSCKGLIELPESISLLSRLIYLTLKGNKLTNLPISISNLCYLKYLDLSGNKFSLLPAGLNKFKSLKKFYFEWNRNLKSFPIWIYNFSGQIFSQKYIKQGVKSEEALILGMFEILIGRELIKAEIEENDQIWYRGSHFYKINKNGNIIGIYIHGDYQDFTIPCIPFIPEQVSRLKHLEELYLPRNEIKEIPKSIENLNSLKLLDLRYNEIKYIPNTLKNIIKHNIK